MPKIQNGNWFVQVLTLNMLFFFHWENKHIYIYTFYVILQVVYTMGVVAHPQIRLWRLPAGVPASPYVKQIRPHVHNGGSGPPSDQAMEAPSGCSHKPIYQPNHVSRTYIPGEKRLGGQWPAPLLVNQVGPAPPPWRAPSPMIDIYIPQKHYT